MKISDITADLSPEDKRKVEKKLCELYGMKFGYNCLSGSDAPKECAGSYCALKPETCNESWALYPPFCSSIDAALALCEKVRKEKPNFQPNIITYNELYTVRISRFPGGHDRSVEETCEFSDLAPAILRCLLRSQGIEKLEV